MSATSGIRIGDWLGYIALVLAAACGVSCLSPLSDGVLTGTVMLGAPVTNAEVRIWRLDLAGQRRDPKPIAETTTDEAGRFRVELDAAFGNLLIEATGGQAREFWATEAIELDASDRLVAVLPLYVPLAEREIVVSPFTTVAVAMAERRIATGEESVYHEAMQRAQTMLGEHLGRIDITDTPVHPLGEPASQLTARVRHGLVLGALSLLAGRMADAAGASVRSINTMVLTHALTADASSEDALLDGLGPQGAIELGLCEPRPECPDCRSLCSLSADTLRFDLAETLAFYLVGSMVDVTGLIFGDVAALADDIAAGVEPLLFGDVAPGAIRDDQGPLILVLASPFFDEDRGVVDFDTMLRPVLAHLDAARVDLARLSTGDCTRALHKHVAGLRALDDNPLRWRFAVSDNAAGFALEDIQVNIRPASTLTPHPLDVVPLDVPDSGYTPGSVFEVVALADSVPALAEVEGRFDIEILAVDRLGNPGPVLRGCWQHVPRAAPLYATQPQFVLGPGSVDSINLDNDEVHRLLGERLDPALAHPFVRIPVQNNTDEVVYLTPTIDELIGTFARTWIAARAFLRDDNVPDSCLTTSPPTCSLARPREPRLEDTVENQQLPGPTHPDAFIALRVIDTAGGFVDECNECRPGEFRLAPRRAYELQAVVTTLDFLVPEGIDTGLITRIAVGATGDRVQLTGFVDSNNVNFCRRENSNTLDCLEHEFYAVYQALTGARIDIQSLRISARTAPSPTLTPRRPRPARNASASTLSTPVSTSYAWSTTEERLPAEDGN